jgi:hypothetical protein
MFPVPSHLPRTGDEPTTSPKNEDIDSKVEVDTVLELFEPLFRGGELDSKTVRGVRESVQAAIVRNKVSHSDHLQCRLAEVNSRSHMIFSRPITRPFQVILGMAPR